ncbi:MAG: nucleoid occlusion factor SlmA, partial [Pseudomonadota bacterium]
MPATKRSNRKEQILQALAQMLETSPGQRITTAKLAAEVGVSEAALYRHFPSKARMFEGLIEFIEDTLLSRINLILENEKESQTRVYNILLLLLAFAEKNPGITRILTGDALQGEQERLRERVQGLFEKLETQFKQVLRERKLREGKAFQSDESTLANFLLA